MIGFALGSRAFEIGGDGRDPYGVESHTLLDVIWMIRNPLPRATTLFAFTSIGGNRHVIGV